MTLLEVEELAAYWHKHPPVHLLVAGFVGYRADDEVATEHIPSPGSDYHSVSIALPPQLLGVPGVGPGQLPPNMPPPILDFEELMSR